MNPMMCPFGPTVFTADLNLWGAPAMLAGARPVRLVRRIWAGASSPWIAKIRVVLGTLGIPTRNWAMQLDIII